MKSGNLLGLFVGAGMLFTAAVPSWGADANSAAAPVANTVITVKTKGNQARSLSAGDVLAYTGSSRTEVTSLEALRGDSAGMELFLYLDDSTRSGVLGTRIPELKEFIRGLPASTKVAIGYMRNGGYDLVQGFTSDHEKAAASVRLPQSVPGINGSPYFALSYLVKHWPSEVQTNRRAVLMLTDGVDRYYSNYSTDNPYVDASIKDSQHYGVLVSSIFLSGEGTYGAGVWERNMAQSRLNQLATQTGGEAYFEGFSSPVSLKPYLTQFQADLNNQYRVSFVASRTDGLQKVQFRSEVPGVKLLAPQRVAIHQESGS